MLTHNCHQQNQLPKDMRPLHHHQRCCMKNYTTISPNLSEDKTLTWARFPSACRQASRLVSRLRLCVLSQSSLVELPAKPAPAILKCRCPILSLQRDGNNRRKSENISHHTVGCANVITARKVAASVRTLDADGTRQNPNNR